MKVGLIILIIVFVGGMVLAAGNDDVQRWVNRVSGDIVAYVTDDGNMSLDGEANLGGVQTQSNQLVCIKSNGDIGTCTDAPTGSGTCTCG